MLEGGVPRDEAGVGRARAPNPDELPGDATSKHGTPNMMMLGRQTRLPVQAMYGAPLGLEEEESTLSEYVAALQGGLRAAYRHAVKRESRDHRLPRGRAAGTTVYQYDDPLEREEYAADFKLDRWERFHNIEGDETDQAYLRTLRKHYGQYQGQEEGVPPGPPSTICLPHTKGTRPDRDVTPTESERARSEQGGSGQEEGEITQTAGDEPGSFTRMRSKDSDSGSDDTTTGRDSWRSARGTETVVLTTPRPQGRGKRRSERGGGIAKRPRMESSSSERRDESEESRSGGTRDRPGRGGRRVARPSTPSHRPPPPSISPRRSPRLTTSAVRDLQNLLLAAKIDRRTAHSRSVSGDEHGRGPSRSSQSSSDHGRSSQGRRSRSREPTPPQLMNFSIDDFTVVSHTMDSFTFTSAHPLFPGWVRVVGAHREDRNTPCAHNPEEEQQARRRVRRDVEPPEVRRFLRQELLKKVGHSWWNRPRVYRHDLADEREPTPSVQSVVVVASDPEQPEVS